MISFTAIVALASAVLGAPSPLPNSSKFVSAAIKGSANRYIVKLKNGVDRGAALDSLNDVAGITSEGAGISHKVIYDDWKVFNGYAAEISPALLETILADPNVEYVEEDGLIQINFDVEEVNVEARSAIPEPVTEVVTDHALHKRQTGSGVDIYSVDTGVYTAHSSFGGRARWGATYGGYANSDGNGHGTHTSATAAGSGYGPATSANVIAVKVLSDSGSGSFSDVISGINYATTSATSSGRPSIINLSLGGSASTSVDNAVVAAINAGVHVTIAAGNSNVDAGSTSPARVTVAYTVGAVSSSNAKASFSNYGSVLDVWYLGVNVLSAYIGSTTASATLSGTSMAAPGVAGILAVEISKYGNSSPATLQASLKSHAQAVVTGAPSGTTNLKAVSW